MLSNEEMVMNRLYRYEFPDDEGCIFYWLLDDKYWSFMAFAKDGTGSAELLKTMINAFNQGTQV
jgi:hypothetical protein